MYYNTLVFYILVYITCILINILIKNKNISIFLISFFLALAFGLRDSVGNDYEQYVNIYNHINIFKDYDRVELGFFYLNKFSFYLFGERGFYFLFFICSFLTYYLILKVAADNNILSTSISLLFFCGFIFFSNNAVRQALVIAILIYSLKYLEREHLKYIILTISSAILIHSSAFLFLLLFLFPKKKSFSWLLLYILIALAFIFYHFDIMNSLIKKVIVYIPKYGDMYYDRVIDFQSKEKGGGLVITFYFISLIYIIYNKRKLKPLYINIFIIGNILFLMAPQVEMWERITIPFYYMTIILFPVILKNIPHKDHLNKTFGHTIILLLFLLFSYQIIENKNKNGVSPFNHIYLNQIDITLEQDKK